MLHHEGFVRQSKAFPKSMYASGVCAGVFCSRRKGAALFFGDAGQPFVVTSFYFRDRYIWRTRQFRNHLLFQRLQPWRWRLCNVLAP